MRIAWLGFVSLLTGILWRAELELRWGWASLDWIGAIHWAVPVGAGAYLAWMLYELRDLPPQRRQLMVVLSAALGVAAYVGGGTAMAWANNRWVGLLPRWQCSMILVSPVVVYAALGAVYYTAAAHLASPSRAGKVAGAVLYIAAFPAACFLLRITEHRGGFDSIHAVKSGFVFPFIAFGLGLPLALRKKPESPAPPQRAITGSNGRTTAPVQSLDRR